MLTQLTNLLGLTQNAQKSPADAASGTDIDFAQIFANLESDAGASEGGFIDSADWEVTSENPEKSSENKEVTLETGNDDEPVEDSEHELVSADNDESRVLLSDPNVTTDKAIIQSRVAISPETPEIEVDEPDSLIVPSIHSVNREEVFDLSSEEASRPKSSSLEEIFRSPQFSENSTNKDGSRGIIVGGADERALIRAEMGDISVQSNREVKSRPIASPVFQSERQENNPKFSEVANPASPRVPHSIPIFENGNTPLEIKFDEFRPPVSSADGAISVSESLPKSQNTLDPSSQSILTSNGAKDQESLKPNVSKVDASQGVHLRTKGVRENIDIPKIESPIQKPQSETVFVKDVGVSSQIALNRTVPTASRSAVDDVEPVQSVLKPERISVDQKYSIVNDYGNSPSMVLSPERPLKPIPIRSENQLVESTESSEIVKQLLPSLKAFQPAEVEGLIQVGGNQKSGNEVLKSNLFNHGEEHLLTPTSSKPDPNTVAANEARVQTPDKVDSGLSKGSFNVDQNLSNSGLQRQIVSTAPTVSPLQESPNLQVEPTSADLEVSVQNRQLELPKTKPAATPSAPIEIEEVNKQAVIETRRGDDTSAKPSVLSSGAIEGMGAKVFNSKFNSTSTINTSPVEAALANEEVVEVVDAKKPRVAPANVQVRPAVELGDTSNQPAHQILSVNHPFLVDTDESGDGFELAALSNSLETRQSAPSFTPNLTQPSRNDATHVVRQISDAIQKMAEGGVELRLNPEELGSVRMQFVSSEQGLNVHIVAERSETLELMRRHIDQLAKDLADSGFDAAGFTFGDEGTQSDQSGNGAGRKDTQNDEATPKDNPVSVVHDGLDIRV